MARARSYVPSAREGSEASARNVLEKARFLRSAKTAWGKRISPARDVLEQESRFRRMPQTHQRNRAIRRKSPRRSRSWIRIRSDNQCARPSISWEDRSPSRVRPLPRHLPLRPESPESSPPPGTGSRFPSSSLPAAAEGHPIPPRFQRVPAAS